MRQDFPMVEKTSGGEKPGRRERGPRLVRAHGRHQRTAKGEEDSEEEPMATTESRARDNRRNSTPLKPGSLVIEATTTRVSVGWREQKPVSRVFRVVQQILFFFACVLRLSWPWQSAMLTSLLQPCPACKATYAPRAGDGMSERKVRDALRHRPCASCKQRANQYKGDRNWHSIKVGDSHAFASSLPCAIPATCTDDERVGLVSAWDGTDAWAAVAAIAT